MEKVRGELLVETVVNVLMPKVVPALIIGYIVWEQTNSAMIYQSISEYTMSSLSTVKPIKKDFEEIARAATEGGSAAGTSEPAKMLLQTVAKEEIKQRAVAVVPDEWTPAKITMWVAGVLVAVAIATVKRAANSSNSFAKRNYDSRSVNYARCPRVSSQAVI